MRPATEAGSMAVTQERTPTPREPVCAICHMPIRAEQDRVTVQEEHYHARCYERREARRPLARAAERARTFTPSAGLSFGWSPTTLEDSTSRRDPADHARRSRRAASPDRDLGRGRRGKLEGLAARNPQKLNWKVSIVDLLKLLDSTAAMRRARSLRPNSAAPPS
jgi:hypothetical protein